MASDDEDLCTNYPDFAVICSFIENFSEKLKLRLPNIEELQCILEDTDTVNPLLAKTVGILLRRINKSVTFDRWERGLQRFAHSYSHQDGWELERLGFRKVKLEVKIRVLKNLLESQFDLYKSFKEKVNIVKAQDLRLLPCGRDKHGVSYWCQIDECANLRVYKDDQDEETWTLVAKTREELLNLIEELQNQSSTKNGGETSVEDSRSGTATPMVLSEAPTPIASGRTSPALENTLQAVINVPPSSELNSESEIKVKFPPEEINEPKQITKIVEEKLKESKPKVKEKLDSIEDSKPKVKEKITSEECSSDNSNSEDNSSFKEKVSDDSCIESKPSPDSLIESKPIPNLSNESKPIHDSVKDCRDKLKDKIDLSEDDSVNKSKEKEMAISEDVASSTSDKGTLEARQVIDAQIAQQSSSKVESKGSNLSNILKELKKNSAMKAKSSKPFVKTNKKLEAATDEMKSQPLTGPNNSNASETLKASITIDAKPEESPMKDLKDLSKDDVKDKPELSDLSKTPVFPQESSKNINLDKTQPMDKESQQSKGAISSKNESSVLSALVSTKTEIPPSQSDKELQPIHKAKPSSTTIASIDSKSEIQPIKIVPELVSRHEVVKMDSSNEVTSSKAISKAETIDKVEKNSVNSPQVSVSKAVPKPISLSQSIKIVQDEKIKSLTLEKGEANASLKPPPTQNEKDKISLEDQKQIPIIKKDAELLDVNKVTNDSKVPTLQELKETSGNTISNPIITVKNDNLVPKHQVPAISTQSKIVEKLVDSQTHKPNESSKEEHSSQMPTPQQDNSRSSDKEKLSKDSNLPLKPVVPIIQKLSSDKQSEEVKQMHKVKDIDDINKTSETKKDSLPIPDSQQAFKNQGLVHNLGKGTDKSDQGNAKQKLVSESKDDRKDTVSSNSEDKKSTLVSKEEGDKVKKTSTLLHKEGPSLNKDKTDQLKNNLNQKTSEPTITQSTDCKEVKSNLAPKTETDKVENNLSLPLKSSHSAKNEANQVKNKSQPTVTDLKSISEEKAANVPLKSPTKTLDTRKDESNLSQNKTDQSEGMKDQTSLPPSESTITSLNTSTKESKHVECSKIEADKIKETNKQQEEGSVSSQSENTKNNESTLPKPQSKVYDSNQSSKIDCDKVKENILLQPKEVVDSKPNKTGKSINTQNQESKLTPEVSIPTKDSAPKESKSVPASKTESKNGDKTISAKKVDPIQSKDKKETDIKEKEVQESSSSLKETSGSLHQPKEHESSQSTRHMQEPKNISKDVKVKEALIKDSELHKNLSQSTTQKTHESKQFVEAKKADIKPIKDQVLCASMTNKQELSKNKDIKETVVCQKSHETGKATSSPLKKDTKLDSKLEENKELAPLQEGAKNASELTKEVSKKQDPLSKKSISLSAELLNTHSNQSSSNTASSNILTSGKSSELDSECKKDKSSSLPPDTFKGSSSPLFKKPSNTDKINVVASKGSITDVSDVTLISASKESSIDSIKGPSENVTKKEKPDKIENPSVLPPSKVDKLSAISKNTVVCSNKVDLKTDSIVKDPLKCMASSKDNKTVSSVEKSESDNGSKKENKDKIKNDTIEQALITADKGDTAQDPNQKIEKGKDVKQQSGNFLSIESVSDLKVLPKQQITELDSAKSSQENDQLDESTVSQSKHSPQHPKKQLLLSKPSSISKSTEKKGTSGSFNLASIVEKLGATASSNKDKTSKSDHEKDIANPNPEDLNLPKKDETITPNLTSSSSKVLESIDKKDSTSTASTPLDSKSLETKPNTESSSKEQVTTTMDDCNKVPLTSETIDLSPTKHKPEEKNLANLPKSDASNTSSVSAIPQPHSTTKSVPNSSSVSSSSTDEKVMVKDLKENSSEQSSNPSPSIKRTLEDSPNDTIINSKKVCLEDNSKNQGLTKEPLEIKGKNVENVNAKQSPLVSKEEDKRDLKERGVVESSPNQSSINLTIEKKNTQEEVVCAVAPKKRKYEPVESEGGITSSSSTSEKLHKDDKQVESTKSDTKSNVKDDEPITDPVLIVKGDGEGSLCQSGNPYHNFEDTNKSLGIPWWEDFDASKSSSKLVGETIVEETQYFWGEGAGAPCDAGNSSDECDSNVGLTKSAAKVQKRALRSSARSRRQSPKKVNGLKEDCKPEESNEVLDEEEEEEEEEAQESKIIEKGSSNLKSTTTEEISAKDINKNEKNIDHSQNENSDNTVDSKSSINGNADNNKPAVEAAKEEPKITEEESKAKRVEPKDKTIEKPNSDVDEKDPLALDTPDMSDEDSKSKVSPSKPPTRGRRRGRPRRITPVFKPRIRPRPSSPSNDDAASDDSSPKPAKHARKSTMKFMAEVPRQRSARIAKIREKEEQERRELEAQRLQELAEENRMKELKKKARDERRAVREIKKGHKEKKEKKFKDKKKKKKRKRAKKKVNKGSDPWAHSSTSSSSEEEEDELEMIEEESAEELVFKSDHEFSPESEVGEEDAQPIKRARTVRKVVVSAAPCEVEETTTDDKVVDDVVMCSKCTHGDHPETILLCDVCDTGRHMSCLRPPLFSVPEGSWLCPACEHVSLVEKLKEMVELYDTIKKKADTEEQRRQRLAYINISLDNVIPDQKTKKEDDSDSGSDSDSEGSDDESGSSSSSSSDTDTDSSGPLYTLRARPARTPKSQVQDFDQLINDAIKDEMEAAKVQKKKSVGRGKDIATIMEGEEEEDLQDGYEQENDMDEDYEDGYEHEKMKKKEPLKNLQEALAKAKNKEIESKQIVAAAANHVEMDSVLPEVKDVPTQEKISTEEDAKDEIPEDPDIKQDKEEEEKHEVDKDDQEAEEEEDDEEVTGTRKKKFSDDDQEDESSEEESEVEVNWRKGRKRGRKYRSGPKKKRRLTDLDFDEEDYDSDEDFIGSSDEVEEDSEEESAAFSSSFNSESETDDSDVIGPKRRSKRARNMPVRRSTRNRRNASDDYDSDADKKRKRSKKRKKQKYMSSSEEEEYSSDSDSYREKRKRAARRSSSKKIKSRMSKKKAAKKPPRKKTKEEVTEDGEPAKQKPRIRYSKPPKKAAEEDDEDPSPRKRVTRGRQINFLDSFLLTDDEESDEEEKPKWRGKVMKGERKPSESSDYEDSGDERKKRMGVSGGLGRGKVMKGEEEDEDYEEEPENEDEDEEESPKKESTKETLDKEEVKEKPPVLIKTTREVDSEHSEADDSQAPKPAVSISSNVSTGSLSSASPVRPSVPSRPPGPVRLAAPERLSVPVRSLLPPGMQTPERPLAPEGFSGPHRPMFPSRLQNPERLAHPVMGPARLQSSERHSTPLRPMHPSRFPTERLSGPPRLSTPPPLGSRPMIPTRMAGERSLGPTRGMAPARLSHPEKPGITRHMVPARLPGDRPMGPLSMRPMGPAGPIRSPPANVGIPRPSLNPVSVGSPPPNSGSIRPPGLTSVGAVRPPPTSLGPQTSMCDNGTLTNLGPHRPPHPNLTNPSSMTPTAQPAPHFSPHRMPSNMRHARPPNLMAGPMRPDMMASRPPFTSAGGIRGSLRPQVSSTPHRPPYEVSPLRHPNINASHIRQPSSIGAPVISEKPKGSSEEIEPAISSAPPSISKSSPVSTTESEGQSQGLHSEVTLDKSNKEQTPSAVESTESSQDSKNSSRPSIHKTKAFTRAPTAPPNVRGHLLPSTPDVRFPPSHPIQLPRLANSSISITPVNYASSSTPTSSAGSPPLPSKVSHPSTSSSRIVNPAVSSSISKASVIPATVSSSSVSVSPKGNSNSQDSQPPHSASSPSSNVTTIPRSSPLPSTPSVGRTSPTNSPGGKWSPHLTSSSGTTPPPHSNSATPPRSSLPPSVNASPPPPYRSSPVSSGSVTIPPPLPHGSVSHHRNTPPNASPHPASQPGYPPYPPPEHFSGHHPPPFSSGYQPPGSHSPGPHGPPRPPPVPPGALPPNHPIYGSISHPGFPQGLPPHHPGLMHPSPHDLYRHPSRRGAEGSPNHQSYGGPHSHHLLSKPGSYHGLEPLPYSVSPVDASSSAQQHSSSTDPPKEEGPTKASTEGEFSSGLMSYFSSQRQDDVE